MRGESHPVVSNLNDVHLCKQLSGGTLLALCNFPPRPIHSALSQLRLMAALALLGAGAMQHQPIPINRLHKNIPLKIKAVQSRGLAS